MPERQAVLVDMQTRHRAEYLLADVGAVLRADEASTVVQIILAHRHQDPVAQQLIDAFDAIEKAHGVKGPGDTLRRT